MKPGEEVVSVNVGWMVERFVDEKKEERGKKPSKAKPAVKTKSKPKAKAPAKTSSPKGKKK